VLLPIRSPRRIFSPSALERIASRSRHADPDPSEESTLGRFISGTVLQDVMLSLLARLGYDVIGGPTELRLESRRLFIVGFCTWRKAGRIEEATTPANARVTSGLIVLKLFR